MAAQLVFTDSFDAYNNVSFMNGKWTSVSSTSASKVVGRTDTGFYTTFAGSTTLPLGSLDNLTVGAFRTSNVMGDAQAQIAVQNSSGACGWVRFNTDGTCSAYDTTGLKATSSQVVVQLNVGHYVELAVLCSTTAGQIIVRVDGEEVINVTGCNTRANCNGFNIAGTGGGTVTWYDDLYVSWDDASTLSFMGDVEVRVISPDAAGNYSQFTPVGSGTNYENVDERPISNTDYNESGTLNEIDTFGFPALTFTGTVQGVQFCTYAWKSDTEIRAIRGVCRIGGTDYLSTNTEYLTTDKIYYRFVWAENPATTAAWTVSEVNSAEFGYKVVV